MLATAAAPAPIAAPAPVAADAIAPPLGIVMHQTTEQARDDGRAQRSFRIVRTLRFETEAGGFRLIVTLISADATTTADERRRFSAANAPMIGRPIVMHLNRAGMVQRIDDLDAVWRDWTAGLTAAVPEGRGRGAAPLRTRLDAMSLPQRQAMVASIADSLFAAPAERTPAAARPITLASPPPFADLALSGTTTATADPGGIRIRLAATGHTSTGGSHVEAITVTSDRLIDPVRGLVMTSNRRESLTIHGAKLVTNTATTLTW